MRVPSPLRQVWRLLLAQADRTVRAHLLLAIVLVGVGGLLSALAPLALSSMVDAAVRTLQSTHRSIGTDALALGAAYVLALCMGRLLADIGPLIAGTAEQRLSRSLTRMSFQHVIGLPMDYLLQRRGGELVRSIDLAKGGSQLMLGHVVNSIVPVLVEAVAMGVVLAHLGQPALLAAFVLTACAYVAIFAAGAHRMTTLALGVSASSMEQHAVLSDSLQHCEPLKAFVGEAAACQRVDALGQTLERSWRDLYRMRTLIGVAVTTVFTVSLATSLYLAGQAVAGGSLTPGGFVLANVYMLQVVRPLEVLGSAVRDVAQAIGFMRPLLDVLRVPTEESTTARPPPAGNDGMQGSVSFQDVCFAYDGRKPILRDLALEVGPARTIAVVGASGSGKSSLVRLLLRLYRPQSGRILLDGRAIDTLHAGNLRSRIGVVPQDTALFHDTIARNIALGRPTASRAEIEQAARLAELHDFVAALPGGYDTVVGERGLQLSGGERQRIAIARALLKRPGVFVFDEATSMLDSRTEAAILRNLGAVTAGCATIVIAHRLSTVMHADEIVVLHDGRIAERGTHGQLLERPGRYAAMWQQQTARVKDGGLAAAQGPTCQAPPSCSGD
jgi:ABC-type multidrug transport system fused ATPase/permease subunit